MQIGTLGPKPDTFAGCLIKEVPDPMFVNKPFMKIILLYITAFIQLIPLSIGMIRFKYLGFIESKIFLFYMILNVGVEVVAHYLAYYHQDNLVVYNISDCCLSLFVAFMIWDRNQQVSKLIAVLFLLSIAGAFGFAGFDNYNPYTFLILYGTIIGLALVRLRSIIKGFVADKQKLWFYLAFLANGVMYINLYYLYSYMLKIRSQGLLPYYIAFNFASSIVFATLLTISFLCRNRKNIS